VTGPTGTPGAAGDAPIGPVSEAGEFTPVSAAPPADRPRIGTGVEEGIAAIAMAAICVITFANVLVRYFTNVSFAFTEEFSVFLMVVMTFAGASAAFARNRHIRMEYFVGKLPRPAHRAIEVIVTLCGFALFALIAWYGVRLFQDDWQ
jgi:TRAP-type C4-dicarboxylate transport system permease small subunit